MKQQSSFLKTFVLVMGILSILLMSWEQSKADAVLAQAGTEGTAIPEESIRLRILADSDAPEDQVLKRRVRDAVIDSMNGWVTGPQTIEEARATIQSRLPELEKLTEDMVRSSGFDYSVKVELGIVPFPMKVYGGQVYPAGDYEAVRITLGRGLGQNWWCVLFPPLCFVDVAAAETPAAAGATAVAAAAITADDGPEEEEGASDQPEVEYRFFLLELIVDLLEAIRSWFA